MEGWRTGQSPRSLAHQMMGTSARMPIASGSSQDSPPLLGPSFLGVPQRGLYPGEDTFFRQNPNVGGMAADDDRVILNPHSSLSASQMHTVGRNEGARVAMRDGTVARPIFDLTPSQSLLFGGYSPDLQDRRDTLAARAFTGDRSAGSLSAEQMDYNAYLARTLGQ